MTNAIARFVPMRLSVFLVLALALSNQISAQDWDEDEDDELANTYWTEEDEQQYEDDYYGGAECDDPSGLCTSTRMGNIRYNSDGTQSQWVGKRTYHSGGTVCTVIGKTTYCN